MTKKLIAIIASLSLILMGVLLSPFFNLNYSVFRGIPGTDRNIITVTRFDLFNPTLSILVPNGNNEFIGSVADYERDNILFFRPVGRDINKALNEPSFLNIKIEKKTLQEAKDLTTKYDLSKENPDINNITSTGKPVNNSDISKLDAEKPENNYYDYINTKDLNNNGKNLVINKFFGLSAINDGKKLIQQIGNAGDLGYPFASKENATLIPEANYRINNPKVNFVAVGFNKIDPRADDIEPEAKIAKIVLVMKDRSFVEVPTKPDGTFDFEAVRGSWE